MKVRAPLGFKSLIFPSGLSLSALTEGEGEKRPGGYTKIRREKYSASLADPDPGRIHSGDMEARDHDPGNISRGGTQRTLRNPGVPSECQLQGDFSPFLPPPLLSSHLPIIPKS